MSTTKHLQLEGLPQAYWTWNFNNNMNTATYQLQRNHHYHYFQHQEEQDGHGAQREHLFEKLLTPSDVGKLNRLVIPKQHAERHFPLDAESGEKGLLLSFECEAGKAWRFRYSYWTSSQSYVLTKGWSRFVKEKRLDAGDVVLFERRRSDAGRLYIGWKRRKDVVLGNHDLPTPANTNIAVVPWNNPIVRSSLSSSSPSSLSRFVSGELQQDFNFPEETTNPKRLRLFGVNLECATEVPDHPRIDPRELQLLPP